MDVGITQSKSNNPIHFVVGLFVLIVGFGAFMFAVRPYVVTDAGQALAPSLQMNEMQSQMANGTL